jgi:hypothetical protein
VATNVEVAEVPHIEEGGVAQEAPLNLLVDMIDRNTALRVITWDATTPPGSPSDGDAYVLASSGIDDATVWDPSSDDANASKVAVYFQGWYFFDPKGGLVAYDETNDIPRMYDETEAEWFPLRQWRTTTEHWTGTKDENGSKLYAKVVDTGALPNTTTSSTAHGITGLNRVHTVNGVAHNLAGAGSDLFRPFPHVSTTGQIIAVDVDGTNIVIGTTYDATPFEDSAVYLEYTKT